jgi:hypothetical protein
VAFQPIAESALIRDSTLNPLLGASDEKDEGGQFKRLLFSMCLAKELPVQSNAEEVREKVRAEREKQNAKREAERKLKKEKKMSGEKSKLQELISPEKYRREKHNQSEDVNDSDEYDEYYSLSRIQFNRQQYRFNF